MTRLAITWAALVLLAWASLGLAYLPLGRAHVFVALAIAFAMAATLGLVCMRIGTAPPLARLFALGSIIWLLVLLALGGTDYATRTVAPAETGSAETGSAETGSAETLDR